MFASRITASAVIPECENGVAILRPAETPTACSPRRLVRSFVWAYVRVFAPRAHAADSVGTFWAQLQRAFGHPTAGHPTKVLPTCAPSGGAAAGRQPLLAGQAIAVTVEPVR